MALGNHIRKTHKIHMNDGLSKDFKNMFIRLKKFGKQKKFHHKRTFEIKVQS
jgi:hypothetical protein